MIEPQEIGLIDKYNHNRTILIASRDYFIPGNCRHRDHGPLGQILNSILTFPLKLAEILLDLLDHSPFIRKKPFIEYIRFRDRLIQSRHWLWYDDD